MFQKVLSVKRFERGGFPPPPSNSYAIERLFLRETITSFDKQLRNAFEQQEALTQ
jgi:hypothetical protein